MTVPTYRRPNCTQRVGAAYRGDIEGMARTFERRMLWFAPHQQTIGSPAPELSVRLEPGFIWDGISTLTEVAAQTVGGFTTPNAGAVRIDRVVVDAVTGVASRVAGVAAVGSPSAQPPEIPSNKIPICQIRFTDADTAIVDSMITDERPFKFANLVDLATFDGTNDYMLRGAGLDGAADSKSGILSVWVKFGAISTLQRLIGMSATVGVAANRFRVARQSGLSPQPFSIVGVNAAGAAILVAASATSYSTGTMLHLLASWDLAVGSGAMHLYVNGVSDLAGGGTYTNDTLDYTTADTGIGGDSNAGNKLTGDLGELYFSPGQWLDFSVEANRRKFILSSGKPAFLGHDGSRPTGTAPLVYQRLRKGEAVANFATNRGTGGNFTITGALATASSSPSD